MARSALSTAVYRKGKVILVEPLGTSLSLGSVGYFSDGQWVGVTNTKSMFGLALKSSRGSADPNSFDSKGGRGFSFEVKAAGVVSDLVPEVGDARLRSEVRFGSKDGFVVAVRNQTVTSAQGLATLMAAIRWAYHYRNRLPEGQRWEKKYAVIIGIAAAKSVTAVSATSSNAAIVIEGSGGLPVPSTPAEVDARMNITRTRESTEQLWRGPARGYAVQAMRIDPSVLRSWDHEDLVLTDLKVATKTLAPRRPASFIRWVARNGLTDPSSAKVNLLTPSGRAAVKTLPQNLSGETSARTRPRHGSRSGTTRRQSTTVTTVGKRGTMSRKSMPKAVAAKKASVKRAVKR